MEASLQNSPETAETAPESTEKPTPPRFDLSKKLEETLRYEAQLKIRVGELQQSLGIKEDEWQGRIREMDQMILNEEKEKALLAERVRQSEERNTALTHQFNELYHYCESLYQDADKRRKETEQRLQDAQNTIEKMKTEIAESREARERSFSENERLESQLRELSEALNRKRGERTVSLSSLVRGKEFIESAVRTLSGFQSSFQTYLDSIDKNGFSPVSLRTAKLFAEHWNVERENLARVSALLADLLESSRNSERERSSSS